MTTTSFTLIENGRSHAIEATTGDSPLRLAAEPLLDALGWTQKPEGLCQGDVCIPVGNRPDLITQQGVDLLGLAEVLGRTVALERDESVASMGAATAAHAS
ncbi:MAG: redoxin domain-containing (seleno)protein, partial [Myxococcota bacterium]